MPAYPGDAAGEIAAHLEALPSGSAVSQVATRLLDLFTSGDWTPGTRLPSERQLATALGVGRSAVREAIAALEILGLVQVRPGSGTYLSGTASELLPQTLSWGVMIDRDNTRELIEVRHALETSTAALAAARIDDAAVAEMRGHLETMGSSLKDFRTFAEADLLFHLVIARSAGNPVMLRLLQNIRSLLRVWVERAISDPADARDALDEHTAVFEAIAARDPEGARQAMEAHMVTAGRRLERSGDWSAPTP